MQFDEDDLTTDSNTVTTKMIITNDGTCARHPHVQLRGKDSSGRNFQRDSCYECDREFEEQQKKLQERQKELDRRLKAIDDEEKDDGDDGRDRIKNMEKIKETEDEISAAPSNSTGVTANTYGGGYPPPPYGAYPMPPPHYGYPPYGYPHYPPPPSSSNSSTKGGVHPSPPPPPPHYAYPPPPGSVGSGGEESSKLFLLLNQKEEELKDLRSKYEESQAQVQRQSMEIARLESRLDQTNANMDQERKIARLEAEAAANERLEILLQGQRREHRETMKQMQDQMAQAAAAISLASHEAPPPPTLENHPAAATDSYDLPKSTDTTLSADSGSLKDDTDYKSYNTQDNLKLPPPAPAPAPIKWDKPRALPSDTESLDIDNDTMASSVLEYIEDNNVPKHTKQKQKARPWESSYVDHNGNGSVVDDVSVGVASAAGKQKEKTPSESDSSNRTEQDDAFDVGDSDNKFVPKYSDPNEQQPILDDDTRSLGQTVASSTYGEDRQKVVNKTLLDPYGDKGCYTGVVLRTTGMPHGLGRMVYEEDGRVYEGDWRHGRWHGYGRASFSNGDAYEGEYKFDQRHGRGVYRWNDGRIYDGQFSEDKRHGNGVFTWPDGAIYDGEFSNGQRQGHGKYTFADGGQYDGGWKDGRYSGFGTCTWEDGRRYRGEWRDGQAHGRGTETYPNGAIRHEGEWFNDEPVR